MPAPVREQRHDDRRARAAPPHGSSTTRGSPPCASTIARNRSSALPSSRAASARARRLVARRPRPCRSSAAAANATASSRSRPAGPPLQQLDRLGDVERVPDGVAERLRHVGDGDAGAAAPAAWPGRRQAIARRSASSAVFMKAPEPGLHVEQDQVGLDRELLRHHARRDQRDRRHRRRGVAQRVERAVGRHEVRGLGRHRAPDLARPARRARPARDRCAGPGSTRACPSVPPVWPRPATRELGDRQAERGRERREDEGDPVGDAAGRVLVDGRAARGRRTRPSRPRRSSPGSSRASRRRRVRSARRPSGTRRRARRSTSPRV